MINYKNQILSLVILVIFSISSQAQKHQKCLQHRKQIKAERVAFITDALDLSVKEAQKFWPLYNDYNKNIEELRDKKHSEMAEVRSSKNAELNEKDYQDFLKQNMFYIEEETKLKKKYQADLLKVFTAKKIFLLYKSEKQFKRKLIKDFRGTEPNCLK